MNPTMQSAVSDQLGERMMSTRHRPWGSHDDDDGKTTRSLLSPVCQYLESSLDKNPSSALKPRPDQVICFKVLFSGSKTTASLTYIRIVSFIMGKTKL